MSSETSLGPDPPYVVSHPTSEPRRDRGDDSLNTVPVSLVTVLPPTWSSPGTHPKGLLSHLAPS